MEPLTSPKASPRPYDREKEEQLMQFVKDSIPQDTKRYVHQSHALADKLVDELKKQKLKKSAFAEKIGKSRAEVRSWLTGMHNLTMRTIATIETTLGTDFIMVLPRGVTEKQVLELLAHQNLIDHQQEVEAVHFPKDIVDNNGHDKILSLAKSYPIQQGNSLVNLIAEEDVTYSAVPKLQENNFIQFYTAA